MSCYRNGQPSRLIYRSCLYRGRKNEKKGFTWADYRDLIIAAHHQLDGPIVLVWDNLRAHLMPQMRDFIEANTDWLTVFQLPSYAPDLNPQEGIWALMKRAIGNLAATNLDQIATAIKHRLKQIQHRPHLIDGCLTTTGLDITI